ALDTSGHGFHLNPGSSLRAALQGAALQFPITDSSNQRAKAIVIVSDGEDPAPDLPPLDAYLARNIHVFTLGIGTPEGGPVPVYDAKGLFQQMLVDPNGTQVTSRLAEARLAKLASDGGGRYFRYDDAANQLFPRDPAGAVTRYRDLQGRRPTAPEISIDLGNALAALGEHDRALVEYSRGIDNAKGTTRAIAFYDRATSLFRLGRILDARASYVEALRLDPNDRDAKFNIEVIDRILGLLRPHVPDPTKAPGQRTPPPGASQLPGGTPAPTPTDS